MPRPPRCNSTAPLQEPPLSSRVGRSKSPEFRIPWTGRSYRNARRTLVRGMASNAPMQSDPGMRPATYATGTNGDSSLTYRQRPRINPITANATVKYPPLIRK